MIIVNCRVYRSICDLNPNLIDDLWQSSAKAHPFAFYTQPKYDVSQKRVFSLRSSHKELKYSKKMTSWNLQELHNVKSYLMRILRVYKNQEMYLLSV